LRAPLASGGVPPTSLATQTAFDVSAMASGNAPTRATGLLLFQATSSLSTRPGPRPNGRIPSHTARRATAIDQTEPLIGIRFTKRGAPTAATGRAGEGLIDELALAATATAVATSAHPEGARVLATLVRLPMITLRNWARSCASTGRPRELMGIEIWTFRTVHHRLIAATGGVVAVLGATAIPSATPALVGDAAGIPSAQRRALGRILAGLPSLRISGRLGRPPLQDGQRNTVWVYYKMRVRSSPDQVRAYWQGNLASGILRDMSRRRAWPRVRGHRFMLALPNGRQRFDSESVLGRALQGRTERASQGRIRMLLEQASSSAGVELVSIRFARPAGRLAPQITLETSDPHGFARDAAANVWKIVAPINHGAGRPRAEGTFVYVRTPQHVWVPVFGYAVRTSSGASAINARFR
jgi:hypothetical protein